MRDLVGKNSETAKTIQNVAMEESKYLLHAMNFLQGAGNTDTKRRMQAKFGKDFNGATQLSKLLKKEAIEDEYKKEIKTFLEGFDRKDLSALATASQARNAQGAEQRDANGNVIG